MGTDDRKPYLRELHEGQRVCLVEWGNLWAEGTVHIVESGGHRYYYGVIARREDIHPTFRTPIRPFSQLWASRVIPGSITICSNRGKIFVSRPTLGTWGTMMAILGDSVENRSPM